MQSKESRLSLELQLAQKCLCYYKSSK
jgi:hypothetical protein